MNKSKQNLDKPEHLFIKNPLTDKLVNILPLFELMDECSHFVDGSTKNLVAMIQDVHDFTSARIDIDQHSEAHNEFQNIKYINHNLIRLRKTFEAMQEFKS